MMEWRKGQMLDSEDLERLWQMSEMQKEELPPPPNILYDVVIGWVLIIVACLAFWSWIYLRFK
jgi:hypothetical protein